MSIEGPAWNVDDLPSSYNGARIDWDSDHYDTAAMPFVVAIRQNFWSWRIPRFALGTGYLNIWMDLPSAMPDGARMISFDSDDVSPDEAHAELAALLRAMGPVLLDVPWTYSLTVSDGERAQAFTGAFGGDG